MSRKADMATRTVTDSAVLLEQLLDVSKGYNRLLTPDEAAEVRPTTSTTREGMHVRVVCVVCVVCLT